MLAFVRQGNRSSGVFTLKPTKQSTRNGRPEMPFDIWQPNYRYRPKADSQMTNEKTKLTSVCGWLERRGR